jgi:hypothetical protein
VPYSAVNTNLPWRVLEKFSLLSSAELTMAAHSSLSPTMEECIWRLPLCCRALCTTAMMKRLPGTSLLIIYNRFSRMTACWSRIACRPVMAHPPLFSFVQDRVRHTHTHTHTHTQSHWPAQPLLEISGIYSNQDMGLTKGPGSIIISVINGMSFEWS